MDVKQQILEHLDFITEYRNVGMEILSTEPNSEGWVPCRAIDREDRNASAAVNVRNGFYTDLGSGQRLDFYAIMQILGRYRSFLDVLKDYASRLGISVPVGRPKKSLETQLDFLPWNPCADQWCGLKHTNRDAVQRAGGTLCRYQGKYSCVCFPVFNGADITQSSPCGYVVSQTNGMKIPVFDTSGKLVNECKIKTISGSGSGLVGTEALHVLQKAREEGTLAEKVLFKVEGITDLTALLAQIPENYRGQWLVLTNAAGTSEKPKPAWADIFSGVRTVVIHDCDRPGQRGAEAWCQWLAGIASEIKNVTLPYPISETHGKDLKDFFTEGHTLAELAKIIRDTEVRKSSDLSDGLPNLANDSPHRIATEFLERNYGIDGVENLYTLVYQQGIWYSWKNGCYTAVATEALQAAVTGFCNTLFLEDYAMDYEAWKSSGRDGETPKVRKVTNVMVSNVLNVLRSMTYTDQTEDLFWRYGELPEECEDLAWLIPVRNGIIHLKRMTDPDCEDYLLPSTPAFFCKSCIPCDFDSKAWSREWSEMVWNNLVDESDNTKHNLLQEFFGYCLIPSTRLQKFLILEGEGSNGKSAVLSGFAAMMGAENMANIPLELFGDKFAMGAIRNRLVNVVDDMSETDRVCEGKLKSIVSGAVISTDRKNRESVNFVPITRLIFACNVRPRFNDTSDGIWRRMEIISFDHRISEDQKRAEYCDMKFWERHTSGILNWCLIGLLRLIYNRFRLTECQQAAVAKRDYKFEINPILRFFEESLTRDPKGHISASELYASYVRWCEANGFKTKNSSNFGKELRRVFQCDSARQWVDSCTKATVYLGIRAKEARDLF